MGGAEAGPGVPLGGRGGVLLEIPKDKSNQFSLNY